MPFRTTINITDSECATSFGVEIKKASDTVWQPLDDQFAIPIVIENLLDSTDYNVRITRRCCNGVYADPVIVNVTGVVAQPKNVTATDIGGGDVYVEWESVPLADSYAAERSTTPGFETPDAVYSGGSTNFIDYSVGSGLFYYRVWSIQAGKQDSTPVVVSVNVS